MKKTRYQAFIDTGIALFVSYTIVTIIFNNFKIQDKSIGLQIIVTIFVFLCSLFAGKKYIKNVIERKTVIIITIINFITIFILLTSSIIKNEYSEFWNINEIKIKAFYIVCFIMDFIISILLIHRFKIKSLKR